MGGYYVSKSYSANYVSNKKNDDGTYMYDSAINQSGITAQRNLQALNKQYNVTINNAFAQHLLANRGLKASVIGSGYKDYYVAKLQNSLLEDLNQTELSVADTKRSIFESLAQDVSQIGSMQLQEINNMRRMAGSLEQYHTYLQGLSNTNDFTAKYITDQGFKVGDEYTFEDNYDKLFDQTINNKGILSQYVDEYNQPGLAFEDWLRQNSGDSDQDTNWLDWAYSTGLLQYQDFIKNGVNSIYPTLPKPASITSEYTPPAKTETPIGRTRREMMLNKK